MKHLYLIALAAAFIPFSWNTPLGFISVVDISTIGLFAVSASNAILSGKTKKADPAVLLSSLAAYLLICASQIMNGATSDASIFIKYFEFLIIIPLSMVFSGINLNATEVVKKIPKTLSLAGTAISILIIIQILRGDVKYEGGVFYINFLGNYINKNALASTLIFSILACAWQAVRTGKNRYWMICVVQIGATFFIGARSAIIIDILLIPAIIFLSAGKQKARLLVTMAAGGIIILAVGVTAVKFNIASDQIARLVELTNVNSGNLDAASSRIFLWEFALEEIQKSPWIGHGSGTFSYTGGGWLEGMYEPHNSILQIFYSGGLLGLLAFSVLIYFGLSKRSWSVEAKCLTVFLVGYFMNTLVGIIWVRGDGHIFWFIFFLVALSSKRKTLRKRNPAANLRHAQVHAEQPA